MAISSHRTGSTVLLVGGVIFVFGGLASAFGYSPTGILASIAAITALLYAGGLWFGQALPSARDSDDACVLFTRDLTIAAGPRAGTRLAALFPRPAQLEIEQRCRAAFDGQGARFSCAGGRSFEVSPIRTEQGAIHYGLLLSGALLPAASAPRFTPVG